MANALIPIGTIKLTTAQTSVVLANLPQNFRDIYIVAKFSMSGTSSASRFQFNGDTGSNYFGVWMVGTGSSTGTGSESSATAARIVGAAIGPTTNQSVLRLSIFDYNQTNKHKTVLSTWGDASAEVQATASRWASTAAVTSMTIYDVLGQSYSAGSTFEVFGVSA